MKQITLFLLLLLTSFTLNSQNCPGYSNTAQASGEACGGQNYTMTVENTNCNGEIYFQYSGSLNGGFLGLGAGSLQIISVLTGNPIATGNGPANYDNETFGPIDPNIYGTVFELVINNGNLTISQNGNVVTSSSGGSTMFALNISISPATITINTPSGPISQTVGNCNDFIVQVPLSNNNYCNILNVNLPWTITCDVTGATLASGNHPVTVYPQVPTDPSDLVDITWNTTTCSWDVSANFDCTNADIGNIFDISPNPSAGPNNVCTNGNETFTVTYTGYQEAQTVVKQQDHLYQLLIMKQSTLMMLFQALHLFLITLITRDI